MVENVKALLFDVFGTVVDWRSSITREGEALGARLGIYADWEAFADDWRGRYQPAMEPIRTGERPYTDLDALHHENLNANLEAYGIDVLSAEDKQGFNRAWHRLDPWPDSVEGLTRLKQGYVIATLSNGGVAIMVNMAKRAGLPWDCILGAPFARQYKPHPDVYLHAADALGLFPWECMMVAAHNGDLRAAQALELRTAFVRRPTEHGPDQTTDLEPTEDWDVIAADIADLAVRMAA